MTVVATGAGPDPESADWRWSNSGELRAMLAEDFAVNTDARSVLVCSDWNLLADGAPFAPRQGQDDWSECLRQSLAAGTESDDARTLAWLAEHLP